MPSVADPERDALQIAARVGLVARGVVYVVIGVLALKLALGSGGKTENQSGALKTIAHQPFGDGLLIVVAAGLGCYAAWRLVEGIVGSRPDEEGGLERRVSAIVGAAAYAGLCYTAIQIVTGGHATSGSPRPATAGVLGWPGGPVLVAIAGAVVIVVGAIQGYTGWSRRFERDSHLERMSRRTRRMFAALGLVGYLARAVTFLPIGYGLIKTALDYSPSTAVGLDGALQNLAHASAGPALLGLVAAGFVAFGVYSVVDARYHRV